MKIFDKKKNFLRCLQRINTVNTGESPCWDEDKLRRLFFLQKENVFSFREKMLFVFKLSTKMVCFVEIFGIVKKGSVCCINIVDLSKISPDEE